MRWSAYLRGVLALGGLAPRSLAQDSPIQLDGSSTVFPISEAMAERIYG